MIERSQNDVTICRASIVFSKYFTADVCYIAYAS